jgi:hypothetical protein
MRWSARDGWTPPRTRLLFLLFLFVSTASFFDATSTLRLDATGDYYEVNPFARSALAVSPGYFLFWRVVSMTLVIGGAAFFSRTYRAAWWILLVLSATYLLVAGYYLYVLFIFDPS